MNARLYKTSADYAVIAICPALIIVMLTALTHFLVLCLYQGQFTGRLMYILFLFIVASTLIARIAIEQTRQYAAMYAVALGAATFLALMRFVQIGGPLGSLSFIFNGLFILLIWWLADRVTFDCTVIEEGVDRSGEGLLDSQGLFGGIGSLGAKRKKVPGHDVRLDGTSGSDETHDSRSRLNRRKQHQPGRWVLYLAVAALPMFGLGQLVLPDAESVRFAALRSLGLYLFATLTLLVTTSFLGVRRYLRQRGAEMPNQVSVAWLGGGALLVALFLGLAFFLPLPGRMIASAELPKWLTSPDGLSASRFGWGQEGVDEGSPEAAKTSQSEQQSGTQSGHGGPSGGHSPGGTSGGEQGERGDSAGREASGGQASSGQSSGSQSSGEQSSGGQSSGKQPPGQQSSGQQSSGQQSSGQQASGKQSPDQQGAGSQSQSSQSQPGQSQAGQSQAGDSQADQSNAGQQTDMRRSGERQASDGTSSDGTSDRDSAGERPESGSSESGRAPRDDQGGANGESGETRSGERESGERESGERESGERESASEQSSGRGESSAGETSGSQESPGSSPSGSWMPNVFSWIGPLLKWLIAGVLLGIIALFVWKNRDFLWDWWQRLLGGSEEGRETSSVIGEESPGVVTKRAFASFRNPLEDGSQPSEAVVTTFQAFEAWGREAGVERSAKDTPTEYAWKVRDLLAERNGAANGVIEAYNRIVYGRGKVSDQDLAAVRELWQIMQRSVRPRG